MPPCEQKILRLLLRAIHKGSEAIEEERIVAALEAAKDHAPEEVTFWTRKRLVFTLLAIDALRGEYSFPALEEQWWKPLLKHIPASWKMYDRKQKKRLKIRATLVAFSERHAKAKSR